jgi:hypothetical protein|tara:strand:- start:10697 stop:10864 length:168 start_codon:yes stop_codon:yes gene_type:complete
MSKPDSDPELEAYLQSLSPKEVKAYHIAKDHLGMTYQYEKSIGYLAWKKSQTENK